MQGESYVIGSGKPPEWCRNFIMPYRKKDGSTGYEYYGKRTTFYLKAGDELIKQDGRILVKENRG